MENFGRIVIFHAAAIGDTVLATPVSAKLKSAMPNATISYVTHTALFPLLKLCHSIDNFHPFAKSDSLMQTRRQISLLKPDLIVDLSGSLRSYTRTAFLAPKVLHYKKQGEKSNQVLHAVDNYLATISCLDLPVMPLVFPTLHPDQSSMSAVQKEHGVISGAIALVPGVGTLRPHRAWPAEKWVQLAQHLLAEGHSLLLIGGKDEQTLCHAISEHTGGRVLNLAGKLSLPETAAALRLCMCTVSGDTGPAHISVAVGTPVVGIYGPTYVRRSGPYAMDQSVIDVTSSCKCVLSKYCTVSGAGMPGACLAEVSVDTVHRQVLNRLEIARSTSEQTS